MKQIGIKLFFIMIVVGLAEAKVEFDLHAQHFSEAFKKKMIGARYDLDDSYASTNLNYVNGVYKTDIGRVGYFNVDVKSSAYNWSTSFSVYYALYYARNKTRSIKLTSENGESIVISFYYKNITFNSKTVSKPTSNNQFNIVLTQKGDIIDLSINGVKVDSAKRESFGNLKSVEVQVLNAESGSSTVEYKYDKLFSLVIGSK